MIEAQGDSEQVSKAYQQAYEACKPVLNELVACLPMLRRPVLLDGVAHVCDASVSPVAKSMVHSAKRLLANAIVPNVFITPMISVAGSVADHVLNAMLEGTDLHRIYVNNGGDIALWLAPEANFSVGICSNVDTGELASRITLRASDKLQGVATSGWRGRSHSLGIADAVTVLAENASIADAAATLIANAVDVPDCERIQRVAASELSPDSDLGEALVTVGVGALNEQEVDFALRRGIRLANQLADQGLIGAAYLSLENKVVVCNPTKRLVSNTDIFCNADTRVCSSDCNTMYRT